ncbi:RT0821/Lpp0805 family surface protein [Aurantimonas sp. A2-1-M11]|uniref:RT0821/Lpp0805 family surface protein n=1 Tax=Aurantimonas sp. A2-1-M11 TaxID=3113712 RepID=UPI002F95FD7C
MASFQILLAGLASLALGGCVIAGPDSPNMIDDTLITGSIAPASPPAPADTSAIPDLERLSDRRTVRSAVSAADIEAAAGSYPWANPQTGTSGVISALQEVREGSRICRTFQTSRQRFDGVSLYDGEACTTGAGEWALVRFVEKG